MTVWASLAVEPFLAPRRVDVEVEQVLTIAEFVVA
jgi:hypothetical protein